MKDSTKAVNNLLEKLHKWEAAVPSVSFRIIGLPEYVEVGLKAAGVTVVRDKAGDAHVSSRIPASRLAAMVN